VGGGGPPLLWWGGGGLVSLRGLARGVGTLFRGPGRAACVFGSSLGGCWGGGGRAGWGGVVGGAGFFGAMVGVVVGENVP